MFSCDVSFLPANTFSVGETIIVKATATFPANNAIMAAAEFDTPAGEQMAVYYDNIQISAPSTVENGVHTMTVDTSNLPESALNKEIGLTVKYIESGNASGATATTNVTVTAVARVKKDTHTHTHTCTHTHHTHTHKIKQKYLQGSVLSLENTAVK